MEAPRGREILAAALERYGGAACGDDSRTASDAIFSLPCNSINDSARRVKYRLREKVEDPADRKSPGRIPAGASVRFRMTVDDLVGKIGCVGIGLREEAGDEPLAGTAAVAGALGKDPANQNGCAGYGGDGCGDGKDLADAAAFFIGLTHNNSSIQKSLRKF